jgi:transcription initiation factor TFIIIB Brf1 subunit/transcription initiation factor TFIIB
LCFKDQDVITDPESGEIICGNCGMVITDKAQDTASPEWRAFTIEEKNEKARTGSPTSLAEGCRRTDFGCIYEIYNRKTSNMGFSDTGS